MIGYLLPPARGHSNFPRSIGTAAHRHGTAFCFNNKNKTLKSDNKIDLTSTKNDIRKNDCWPIPGRQNPNNGLEHSAVRAMLDWRSNVDFELGHSQQVTKKTLSLQPFGKAVSLKC